MNAVANITIHASQFPENVRRDLHESLRMRRVNHKFHYDSVKQTQKWLALHQIYSPSRNDTDCRAIYERAFKAATEKIKAKRIHVIGLGCGGGQKDTRLLKLLKGRGSEIFYTPCDVSPAMVLTARQTALTVLSEKNCFPFVCDLATAGDLAGIFKSRLMPHASCLITFFGMIPNFEPEQILPQLASLIGPNDFLLFSANLAPGNNYAAGVKKILPQYDNEPTRDWLMAFLFDLGIEKPDGKLEFAIQADGLSLKRVVATFHFKCTRQVEIESEIFNFKSGEKIRLFFSYRYTPGRVCKILAAHNLKVCEQWIANSGEEGVFLCRRK